ncbi:MAG: DUF3794 domain-containing protein [Clostridiales bacterium]|nr:DUF3794 domain-containing protein [Clostridiales bacterium]
MDYMLDREALAASELIYDGCQEQPVDLDVSLPDYCPDIQRILKCQVYPRILSKGITGDRLELEGSYTVKVFYLDSAGTFVRCCDSSDTFSVSIPLKQSAENAQIIAFPRVEYINCRATSPRRLDIHGAFSVCARVMAQTESEVVSGIEGDDVEQKKDTLTVNRMVGLGRQQFSVDEVLELGQGKPTADNIMRTDAFVAVQDFKVIPNKIMAKGEVYVRLLYSSGESDFNLEAMEYAVPFTQMVDCDGATEDCMCDLKISVIGVDIQIKNDYSGDKIFFDAQIKLFADAAAYLPSEVTIVTDAYSKKYDMNIESKQKSMDNLVQCVCDNYVLKTSLSTEDTTVTKVLDIWNEMSTVSASCENDQLVFKGKINLCVLALNEESRPFYFERMADFEYAKPYTAPAGNLRCSAEVCVGGISYRIMGAGLEVKAELKLCANVSVQQTFKMITEVTADETKPRARDQSAALSIYYADAGETIWNIARTYCTSADAIRLENDFSGDSVENRRMLLIPM